ncbi:hypothetical protein B0G73_114126 [Paraburkholderia sp. BL25I1N1]|nr:hypothetical protein B0G73_114126 [Paraburkholderia sp. BL25I1N1]
MTFTTDRKPCGCTRRPGSPKCTECAPRRRKTADRAHAKHLHIDVDEILTMMRAHLRTKGKR